MLSWLLRLDSSPFLFLFVLFARCVPLRSPCCSVGTPALFCRMSNVKCIYLFSSITMLFLLEKMMPIAKLLVILHV